MERTKITVRWQVGKSAQRTHVPGEVKFPWGERRGKATGKQWASRAGGSRWEGPSIPTPGQVLAWPPWGSGHGESRASSLRQHLTSRAWTPKLEKLPGEGALAPTIREEQGQVTGHPSVDGKRRAYGPHTASGRGGVLGNLCGPVTMDNSMDIQQGLEGPPDVSWHLKAPWGIYNPRENLEP